MQFLWENHREVIRDTMNTDMSLRSSKITALWFKLLPGFLGLFYSIPASGLFTEPRSYENVPAKFGIAISGLILGPVFVMLLAFYIKLAGSWLGGKGNWNPLRIVLAWAQTPHFAALLIGFAVLQGKMHASSHLAEGLWTATWYLFYILAAFATALMVIYYLVGVSEVLGISKLRSFFVILIAHFFMTLTVGACAAILISSGLS